MICYFLSPARSNRSAWGKEKKMLITTEHSGVGRYSIVRLPSEIREEISRVSERISILTEQIDIREMLGEILSMAKSESCEKCLNELEEMIDSARESLRELERLKKSLELLAEELEDSKWITECS